ncbi:hypothetical protein D1AOALGA4SA_4859 [Olavius algarvensis Delta 1 endosymbiont]|nr:hypothetical protein D1AOALGA4SA_4859 [Olavius algarvensis Delta 1 endosymbiont]
MFLLRGDRLKIEYFKLKIEYLRFACGGHLKKYYDGAQRPP